MWLFFCVMLRRPPISTPYCHTLSLHDALPISQAGGPKRTVDAADAVKSCPTREAPAHRGRGMGSLGSQEIPCPQRRLDRLRHTVIRVSRPLRGVIEVMGDKLQGEPLRRRPGQHLVRGGQTPGLEVRRSEEHTSELQSLMRISYAVFCLKK